MKEYGVVFNYTGPCHLYDDDRDLTLCGIKAPGLETRVDDSSITEDGILYNSRMGKWWPENIDHFCKRCLKAGKVNKEKTIATYKIFLKIK